MKTELIFEKFRRKQKNWWELLPLRKEFALILAKDRKFWEKEGQNFGWFYEKTPYEAAIEEVEHAKNKLEEYEWFYEESGIFEIPLCRSKVGSWCYWIAIKHLLKGGKKG